MFIFFIYKLIDFSKIYIYNLNLLINLFDKLFILLNKLNCCNNFYYNDFINVASNIKVYDIKHLKYFISRRFNLFYQKKLLINSKNDLYKF